MDSQRRELTDDLHRSSGSFELVLSPLLLALVGYGLDRWFGTLPVFTVLLAVMGVAGAAIKLYIGYESEMAEHEEAAPWARRD